MPLVGLSDNPWWPGYDVPLRIGWHVVLAIKLGLCAAVLNHARVVHLHDAEVWHKILSARNVY